MAISPGAGEAGLEAWLELQLSSGVAAVQVREKALGDRALLALVRRVVERLGGRCRVLVNGRADVALAAGAHGVHLPQDGLPAAELRRRCGERLLIGRSAHHPAEVLAARHEGCDYVVFGPVRATPGKGAGGIPGFAGLAAAAGLGIPVLALGGIESPADAERVKAAGAAGVAAIRGFADPATAAALAGCARRLWEEKG